MKRNGARNGMMMSDPPQVKTDIIMAASHWKVGFEKAKVRERRMDILVN